MNSVLSTIAAVVVLLLIAALVGPTFVDWNSFRSEIEAQGKKLTGRELTIGGDISFVVLPAPHLTLNNVSLDNLKGAENSDFARVGQLDAEVALAPLISGKISVTSVTVTRPQIHLEVLPDGRSNWRGLVSGPVQEDGLFGLSSVSLEKASFVDGTVTYSDHRTGRSWRIDRVGGDITATSLVGPMRADLLFEVDDAPFALRLALGNFSAHRAFPITAELQGRAAPAKLLFSGVSTGFSSNARIDGTGSLEVGSTKTENGEKPKAPFRVEAGIVAGEHAATFRDLAVAMAGTTLRGEAKARWSGRPTASVRLSGEALTLDPAVDRLREALVGAKVPLGPLANLALPQWLDVDADVKVGALLVHDVLIKDAALALSLDEGKLHIARAAGDIGSGTQFELSGTLTPGAPDGRFEGKARATSGNLAALAAWLSALRSEPANGSPPSLRFGETGIAPAPAVPQVDAKAPRRPFSIAADVILTAERLDFQSLRAAYAAAPDAAELKGNLTLTNGNGRPLLSGALTATRFDLDPLIALWPKEAPGPRALLEDYDADLAVVADRLTVAGETIAGLDGAAAMTKGDLDLKHFNAADLAGAKLAIAGKVRGATKPDISSLQADLHGTIEAPKTEGLFRLAGIDAPGVEGPLQLTLDTSSGQAEDSQARLDTLAVKGTIGGSRVDAVLKRGQAAEGDALRIDLNANAVNDDGRVLLRQLGLTPGDVSAGAGTVSLQMNGTTGKPFQATMRVNVGEGTFTAKGGLSDPLGRPSFAGHIDMSASSVAQVLTTVGATKGIADFAAAQAAGPSFVLSTDARIDKDALALVSLETVAGNFHLSGDATYRYDAESGPASLTGRLEANALDLTPLFTAGRDAADGYWPSSALDWSALDRFDGTVELKAGRIALGTLRLDQNDLHVALAKGVLSASPFTAKFADGRATIGARIEGGASGEPGIGLAVTVEGADIAVLGPQAFGASFGTGRIDIDARLEGQGRSWLALVSSASGTGSFRTRSMGLTPLDVPRFSDGLKALKSLDAFAALEEETLKNGNTPASGLEGDFAMKDGVVRFDKDGLELKGGKAKIEAMFDLARLAADSELVVTLAEPQGAPPFKITAAAKVGAVKRRVDTAAVRNFISTRLLEESAAEAGLTFIPKELKKLIGISDDDRAKGPAVAGIPLPLKRPEPKASLQ